ncbi:MAG: hypothetical protein JNN26_12385 [Candidatus Obscuribacter sp.]|nr:hypothetical protein [Candidatus Obscuribacter sp.]
MKPLVVALSISALVSASVGWFLCTQIYGGLFSSNSVICAAAPTSNDIAAGRAYDLNALMERARSRAKPAPQELLLRHGTTLTALFLSEVLALFWLLSKRHQTAGRQKIFVTAGLFLVPVVLAVLAFYYAIFHEMRFIMS